MLSYGLEKKGYDSWTFEECLEIAPVISDLGFHFFEQLEGTEFGLGWIVVFSCFGHGNVEVGRCVVRGWGVLDVVVVLSVFSFCGGGFFGHGFWFLAINLIQIEFEIHVEGAENC